MFVVYLAHGLVALTVLSSKNSFSGSGMEPPQPLSAASANSLWVHP